MNNLRKRTTLTILILLTTLSVFAQKDTVKVLAYEKYDTARAVILYPGENNVVKFTPGFVILKGFASQKDGKWYWEDKPALHMVLDEKKKQLKEWLQIL